MVNKSANGEFIEPTVKFLEAPKSPTKERENWITILEGGEGTNDLVAMNLKKNNFTYLDLFEDDPTKKKSSPVHHSAADQNLIDNLFEVSHPNKERKDTMSSLGNN